MTFGFFLNLVRTVMRLGGGNPPTLENSNGVISITDPGNPAAPLLTNSNGIITVEVAS